SKKVCAGSAITASRRARCRSASPETDVRSATIALVTIGVVVIASERVGERDRIELSAIAAIRAITSGESAYAAANGGHYDTLERLIANDFLSADFLLPSERARGALERRGYRFELQQGPAMRRYAIVATPIGADAAQRRSFCADDRLSIYVAARA